ncbi:unnamed protein product [Bursaphelenchus okinawaensis]|uniref:N-alpha-acetyltransferase 20 n=1 Tax=Bursaphelenchus okinawaensis TaxID=465554 RepID=A0A811LCV6_9BILA|nr:unnamed protein product [Bursaphelenchus okinawaensis]CAG9120315.1 unnamed protein product [Bursaphelenchus okinawaensis]
MKSIRPFQPEDLRKFNVINLDRYTETYTTQFYLQYKTHWPEYFQVAEAPDGTIMGYIMGKAEGRGENWHGHVTAVSVAPEFRRMGLGRELMTSLEKISEEKNCYFVDLFVRVSNTVAVAMYESLGYVIYRRIISYYTGDNPEDAYDMRKALSRDMEKKSVIPLKHPVHCDDLDDD